MFDGFAATFDAKLADLDYRAPELMDVALGAAGPLGHVADLGCGTGLMGPLLRPRCSALTGVDLSVGMLRQAQRRGAYDHLYRVEMVDFLRDEVGRFDTIVSTDALCYLGALDEFVTAALLALRPDGVLAFTVEALPDDAPDDWAITPSGRYAHAEPYLRRLLAPCRQVAVHDAVLRQEAGHPVVGHVVVATR